MSEQGMDEELRKVIATFEAQTWDGLAAMEEALLELEARPGESESIQTIFRICHTLKGDADSLGFAALTEFAHVLEDLLGPLRSGEMSVTAQLVTRLLEAVDALRDLLASTLEGRDELDAAQRRLLEALRARALESDADATSRAAEEPPEPREDTLLPEAGLPRRLQARNPTLRVRVETLDRLMNLAGELAIARGHLDQAIVDGDAWDRAELLEAHRAMDHLFAQLQEEVMRVRMVPLGPVFRQHIRGVRELAISHAKRARLEIQGEDAELDTTVIEHLREALIHIVRNAVAHGIESPEVREAKGKDPCGRVSLSARQDGAQIVVEITDDGSGLDRDAIRRRALELGLSGDLSHHDLAELIFRPGFSTTEQATLASGRGVGMDAVRRSIETVGGSVLLESTTDVGTVVTLRLPLTLAIIDGFAVGVGDEVYVLPLACVIECLDHDQDAGSGAVSGLINLRERPLPFVQLGHVLDSPPRKAGRPSVVVVEHAGDRLGLIVDRLFGERQAVIKPLARNLRDLPGVAGSTILGDGRVALILDVPTLVKATLGISRGSGARLLTTLGAAVAQ
jgi:two-component system chemotaxis sensor kinase CheA